jgi:hypothetical protein
MTSICRNMSGYNLERINKKNHYFLEHLLIFLQTSRLCVKVRADTLFANGTEFTKLLLPSSCPVFRISSGLAKFHVLSNSDVRIPLPPPPASTPCNAHSADSLRFTAFVLPRLLAEYWMSSLSLSLSRPVPLLAQLSTRRKRINTSCRQLGSQPRGICPCSRMHVAELPHGSTQRLTDGSGFQIVVLVQVH